MSHKLNGGVSKYAFERAHEGSRPEWHRWPVLGFAVLLGGGLRGPRRDRTHPCYDPLLRSMKLDGAQQRNFNHRIDMIKFTILYCDIFHRTPIHIEYLNDGLMNPCSREPRYLILGAAGERRTLYGCEVERAV